MKSPPLIRGRSVNRGQRYVDQQELHRELAAMMDQVVQVLADHFSARRSKDDMLAAFE